MKNLSSLSFIFLFFIIASVSFLSPISLADQTVLDKYGSPLILNEQEIILKNNLDGFISWEDFNKKYRLRGINGVWHIVEKEEKVIPDYQPKPIDYEELKESFAHPRKQEEVILDYQPKPIDHEELKESFAHPRKHEEVILDYQPKPIEYEELKR